MLLLLVIIIAIVGYNVLEQVAKPRLREATEAEKKAQEEILRAAAMLKVVTSPDYEEWMRKQSSSTNEENPHR